MDLPISIWNLSKRYWQRLQEWNGNAAVFS